jgi:hypothetical protein
MISTVNFWLLGYAMIDFICQVIYNVQTVNVTDKLFIDIGFRRIW